MLAQRAVEDSPRWTRAVEDQSDPIPERQWASSGGTFILFDARSEGQPRPLPLREVKESESLVGHAHWRINQATLENEVEVNVTRAVGACHLSGWWLSPSDSRSAVCQASAETGCLTYFLSLLRWLTSGFRRAPFAARRPASRTLGCARHECLLSRFLVGVHKP